MRFYHASFVFILFILIAAPSARADYEVYRVDGFEKVHEIIERKTNENGTLTIRAKKSKNSNKIVVIQNVVEIKDVAAKSGPKYMKREQATPVPTLSKPAPKPKPQKSASADVPWVRKLSKTVVGVMIGIVASFIILFIWVKSSN